MLTDWFYWLCIAIYSATIISIIYIILKENRNPVRSLAWITVLFFLPVAGLVLYLFFGRSIKNKALISKRLKKRFAHSRPIKQADIGKLPLTAESRQQIRLGHKLSGAIYFPDNDVECFVSGAELFEAFKRDLMAAQCAIDMQFYIFNDDKLGTEISDILIDRSRNGVKVRIIYDHVGCFGVKKKFFMRMADAGIDIHPFFKVTFPEFATRVNWRNHRKITVIDNRIGYIGGMNVADRYVVGDKMECGVTRICASPDRRCSDCCIRSIPTGHLWNCPNLTTARTSPSSRAATTAVWACRYCRAALWGSGTTSR